MKKILTAVIVIFLLGLVPIMVMADENAIPYRSVARDGHLELYVNDRTGSIQVFNHNSGHRWQGTVDDELYDKSGVNRLWVADMRSPLVISHTNILLRDAPSMLLRSNEFVDWVNPDTGEMEQTIFISPIHNGVEVRYTFPSLHMEVTVLYWLEDGALVVRIPYDRIIEEVYQVTDHRGRVSDVRQVVTAINLLPYFGAAHIDEIGYIFFPDGSGAITRFENWQYRPQAQITQRWSFFSDTSGRTEGILYGIENTAYFPVFGIRNQDNAFLAAITEGYDFADLQVITAGNVIDLYRASFSLRFRGMFEINMNAISGATGRATMMATRTDVDIVPISKEVRFFILDGDDANYSGMARAYREHLLNTGVLQNNITAPGRLPLYLQLFMGIEEAGMLFNSFVRMTTFDQVQTILNELVNRGVQNIETMLRGWHARGFGRRLANDSPARQLGGRSGLRDLNTHLGTSALSNVHVHLEQQFNFALQGRGFSARRDVAINGVRIPLQGTWENFFALRPIFSLNLHTRFLNSLRNLPNLNIAYRTLGRTLFSDYNRDEPLSRGDAADIFRGMTQDAVNDGRRVMMDGANIYMMRYTNFVYNIPNNSRGIFITDEDVPFVQMVLSGLVGISGEKGNLSSDLNVAMLRWIETGTVPAFELTYRDSVNLQNTDYATLFTSTFANWVDEVVAIYEIMNEELGHVFGQQMVSHERVQPYVARVMYADGTTIYVNYNYFEVTVGSITIPAVSFVVTR